ncbi:ES1-like protein [Oopsacas minuta]|uniref:ES1-like protein n=1 Tax=Oopsacas minuta TaxID=111878 RepID=A0AAV7JR54_9METZ|nr:ES1-like protein [Oopsacas minuta]
MIARINKLRGVFTLQSSLLHVYTNKFLSTSSYLRDKRAALVLSGSGVYDGTEIHEASACLVHLSRHGTDVSMFAPDVKQMHVIDHSKGAEMSEERNVLIESARIARGNIEALSKLSADNFDCLVIPGGFGAAKNLSTFATEGIQCRVNSAVERVVQDFHRSNKPIAFCCISSVIAAKVLGNVEVTVGGESEEDGKWPYAGTVAAIRDMGGIHFYKEVTDTHIDHVNRIVTCPAFMGNAPLHHVYDGIGKLIFELLQLIK